MNNSLSNRPQNNPVNNPNFFLAATRSSQERAVKGREKYLENPKICPECGIKIPYEKRNNTFCSKSCATSHSNRNRTEETKEKQKETLAYTLNLKDGVKGPHSKVTFALCQKCEAPFRKTSSSPYCDQCNSTHDPKYQIYKTNSAFIKEELNDIINQNLDLIEKIGWYAPSNSGIPNLTGLVFDHLYRRVDGYRNGLDPIILRHPANAEIVPQPINYERLRKSTITVNELFERILLWESGSKILPRFWQL